MKKTLLFSMTVAVLLAACSGGGGGNTKKLLIISSGKFTVDASDNKRISWEPGNQHNEQELQYGTGKISIIIKSPEGEKTYDMPEDGAWLLNLKKDTVVGGLVKYGSAGRPSSITAEVLDRMIDSTQKLLLGQNTSDASKTYFIVPQSIKKISSDASVRLLSPFKYIPAEVEVDKDGKTPEYYKFFTNSQKREDLNDLLKRLGK